VVPLGLVTLYEIFCIENGLGQGKCLVYDLYTLCPEYRDGWSKYRALLTEGGCDGACILEHVGHFAKAEVNLTLMKGDGRMPLFPKDTMLNLLKMKHNGTVITPRPR